MMPSNDYHMITHWRVKSTVEEVFEIISDAPSLMRWWPAVYLDVKVADPGGEDGIGTRIDLYTKGWLPYTLRWEFQVVAVDYPHCIKLEANGDFVGRGIWTFEQDGEWVNITYDWKIRADKSLLKYGSFIIKPILRANHFWAMRKGEESLQLELERRHAGTAAERAQVPAPPQPTTALPVPLLLGTTGLTAAVVAVIYLSRKRS